jgi:hypothetical protein
MAPTLRMTRSIKEKLPFFALALSKCHLLVVWVLKFVDGPCFSGSKKEGLKTKFLDMSESRIHATCEVGFWR